MNQKNTQEAFWTTQFDALGTEAKMALASLFGAIGVGDGAGTLDVDLISKINWEKWCSRISHRNAWLAILMDGDYNYECRIIVGCVGWIALHYGMRNIAHHVGQPLASRPTVVGNTLHCAVTSTCAFAFLLAGEAYQEVTNSMWQRWVLPFTIS